MVVVLSTAVLLSISPALSATPDDNPTLFESAVRALQKGAHEEAIDTFELLSDRGFVHPDLSFNRAAAYLLRARSPQAQPGDLGRVAAGLSETLKLRPEDAEAGVALEKVRAEISRRRAREGAAPMLARPSLDRAVVDLLPENVWAMLAALGAFTLSIGLIIRLFVDRPGAKVAGSTSAAIGALLFLTFGSLAFGARHFRLTSRPAVVVVPEARLVSAQGKPTTTSMARGESDSIPEGAEVYVREQQGGLARIDWGTTKGWVRTSQLRILSP
jgi:hypothetical protein